MINNRDYFRLRKQMDVSWSILEQKIEGEGKIFNISLSGMSFETDRLFLPEHGLNINFSSKEIPSLPPKGHLVWFHKVGAGKRHYHCGIRFNKGGTFAREWAQWMDNNILKLADIGDSGILRNYLSADSGG